MDCCEKNKDSNEEKADGGCCGDDKENENMSGTMSGGCCSGSDKKDLGIIKGKPGYTALLWVVIATVIILLLVVIAR